MFSIRMDPKTRATFILGNPLLLDIDGFLDFSSMCSAKLMPVSTYLTGRMSKGIPAGATRQGKGRGVEKVQPWWEVLGDPSFLTTVNTCTGSGNTIHLTACWPSSNTQGTPHYTSAMLTRGLSCESTNIIVLQVIMSAKGTCLWM